MFNVVRSTPGYYRTLLVVQFSQLQTVIGTCGCMFVSFEENLTASFWCVIDVLSAQDDWSDVFDFLLLPILDQQYLVRMVRVKKSGFMWDRLGDT